MAKRAVRGQRLKENSSSQVADLVKLLHESLRGALANVFSLESLWLLHSGINVDMQPFGHLLHARILPPPYSLAAAIPI